MDSQSYALSKRHTNNEIAKVNQTIVSITSGIKSIVNTGSNLIFTLSDNSTLSVTITGLSDNNYTTIEKNKLALLNSDILSKFTHINSQLLFDGQPISGTVDLSEYIKTVDADNKYEAKDSSIVKDSNYVHTDANFSQIYENKLNTLENFSKDYNELSNKPDLIVYAKTTDVNNSLSNKVDVIIGKELSTNDYTDSEKQKVNSMTGGNQYRGLFDTYASLSSITNIATGNWVTVNVDETHSNKKTKYYYDLTWIYDGEYQESSFGIDDNSIDSTQNGWSASKLENELSLKANTDGTNIDLTAVQGDIIPATNGIQNIGSPTNRFSKIYVNEAMLSTNTLYIGDTPVLGTTDDTIMVKADLDQSLTVKTTGVGTTKIISQSNVELSTSGMNANINVQATGSGANANLSATNEVNLTAPHVNITGATNVNGDTTVGNLTVGGNLVVNGNSFTVESTTVRIEDNIIELNKNEVGTGVTAGKSGIKINRGDSDAYLIVFDETDDNFKIGTDSLLKIVATQDYVNSAIATGSGSITYSEFVI